jgi:ATP-dependent DNA helicase RecG
VKRFYPKQKNPLTVKWLRGYGRSAQELRQTEILHNCLQEKSLLGIMSQVGRKDRTKFRTKFIKPLVESGLLEMTTPDKPRSSKQHYRTTDLGRKTLAQWSEG